MLAELGNIVVDLMDAYLDVVFNNPAHGMSEWQAWIYLYSILFLHYSWIPVGILANAIARRKK